MIDDKFFSNIFLFKRGWGNFSETNLILVSARVLKTQNANYLRSTERVSIVFT